MLHQFSEVLNIVQATINQSRTVFGYVMKQKVNLDKSIESEEEKDQSTSTEIEMYEAYVAELKGKKVKIHNLDTKRSKQVRIQFLYKEKEHGKWDKFLLLIHQECMKLFLMCSSYYYIFLLLIIMNSIVYLHRYSNIYHIV